MADLTPKTIGELPTASTLNDADIFPLSQSSAAKKTPFSTIKDAVKNYVNDGSYSNSSVSPTSTNANVTHYGTYATQIGKTTEVSFNFKLDADLSNNTTVMTFASLPAPKSSTTVGACFSASSSSYVGMMDLQPNGGNGFTLISVGSLRAGNYIRCTIVYLTY